MAEKAANEVALFDLFDGGRRFENFLVGAVIVIVFEECSNELTLFSVDFRCFLSD